MPDTPIYSLPYESPPNPQVNAEPGISLHGGSAGGEDILAKAVEDELERIDTDIADLEASLDTRPGWHTIFTGQIVEDQDVAIPSGVYGLIWVHIRGRLTDEARVTMRVNDDGQSGLHRTAWAAYRLDTGAVANSNAVDTTVWSLAQWGDAANNVANAIIYSTDGDNLLSYESTGYRAAGGTAVREKTLAGGDLSETRLLSSLRFSASGSESISGNARLWIQGHIG